MKSLIGRGLIKCICINAEGRAWYVYDLVMIQWYLYTIHLFNQYVILIFLSDLGFQWPLSPYFNGWEWRSSRDQSSALFKEDHYCGWVGQVGEKGHTMVCWTLDTAIHWVNCYPEDDGLCFARAYLLDSGFIHWIVLSILCTIKACVMYIKSGFR